MKKEDLVSGIRSSGAGGAGSEDPSSEDRRPKTHARGPSIRILPPDVVNRIAAGEVIERPASVLKELVENAVDADSTEVTVVLEEGGKKRILVRDNGRGMTPEDLPLAFYSHATSKLRDEDLLGNTLGSCSLGFRGEALASIGSVGMVEVVSRTPRAEHASRYRPGSDGPEPAAGEPGTTVEVLNLFYNTPARRKFLRTGSTELSHCVQQFVRIAMASPGVHMRLFHGQRSMFDLLASDEVGERLRQIVPAKISDHLLPLSEGDDPELPHLEGFIGEPRVHRRDTKEQHFYVNGRWVRDRTLTHALRSAYQGFLIPGYQPVAYLFIDTPRGDVDANVHPTKTEVRFRDSSAIYRLVHHAVRRALESSAPPGGLDGDHDGDAPVAGRESEPASSGYTTKDLFAEISGSRKGGSTVFDWASSRPSSPVPRVEPVVRRFEVDDDGDRDDKHDGNHDGNHDEDVGPEEFQDRATQPVEEIDETRGDRSPDSGGAPGEHDPERDVAEARRNPLRGANVLQVMNSFLVVDLSDRMLLLDQHALHEIILFEAIYRRLVDGVVESQRLLVPEVVRVPAEYLPLVDRAGELLGKFGFELEAFGPDSVALHAIPSIFDREAGRTDIAGMVGSVLESLQDGFVKTSAGRVAREREVPLGIDEQLRDIGATIACKRAVKAGMTLSPEEIRSLLDRAGSAVDPRHCPHGRPTVVSCSRAEVEKMFDRR